MVAQGLSSPAPPQVLKALQGARWLSPDSDTYVGDLFDIVGEYEAFDDDDPTHTTAAGCRPSAVADSPRNKSSCVVVFTTLLTGI